MKKIIIFVLVLTLVLIIIPAMIYAGNGPVVKMTGKDAATLSPAFEVYPGGIYDTAYTHEYAGASGKVNMVQPNGNVDVIIAVSASGLTPGETYRVFFDTNGVSSPGPWTLMGTFVADGFGEGAWNYTAPAGEFTSGEYRYSVFINEEIRGTILISEDVEFSIE